MLNKEVETVPVINSTSIQNKKVLLRFDGDVPVDEEGHIVDDYRLRAVLPTLNFCREQDASVIMLAHRDRPEGKKNPAFSNIVLAHYFSKLMGSMIPLLEEIRPVTSSSPLLMLENLRFFPGEEKNDQLFAANLAKMGDFYCNDAFAVSHRAHASVDALPRLLPHAAGLRFAEELRQFTPLRHHADAPYVAVMGGAKASDKSPIVEDIIDHVDSIIIGGLVAVTYVAAMGHNIGKHEIEPEQIKLAQRCIRKSHEEDVPLYLPRDFINQNREIKPIHAFSHDDLMLDIGPASYAAFARILHQANTIFWNGAMGKNEDPAFAQGTLRIAQAIAKSDADVRIVSGGDTVGAIHEYKLERDFTFISTGGGATLEYIAGRDLPGLMALQ